MIHTAVLRSHVHKERLRVLSLRLLINKLSADPTNKKQVAALCVQIAWGNHQDKVYFRSTNFDPSAAEKPVRFRDVCGYRDALLRVWGY